MPPTSRDFMKAARAAQVLEFSDRLDPTKLQGIMLTPRFVDERKEAPGTQRPSIMIPADHPDYETVLKVLTGVVAVSKQDAQKVVEDVLTATTRVEKTST